MTTSRQRRWSFDTSRWGKYARPSRASRDAAAFSPHVGKNRCKKFGTALGQRRTLEADVPVGGVHLFSGVVRVGHDAHRTRHRRLFAFSASNLLRTGCKMSKRKCRHSRASGNPAARKSLDPRFRGDDIGSFYNQFLEAVSELHAENVDRAFISSDELPVAWRRCRIGLIDRSVLDKQMRVPEVERTVLRQLVLAAKRQPQAIVVGQSWGAVGVVDRCLVEREAHLRGGRGRKEEARLIFLSIAEYKEPFP